MFAVAALSVLATSAQAQTPPEQLQHRWSFNTDATDLIGNADWTLEGTAMVAGGSLALDGTGTYADGNLSRAVQPGSNININTYPSITLELWATPSTANTGFVTVAAFGQDNDVNGDGNPQVPINSYFIQPQRGNNVSRTAISVSSDGSPWDEEDGADGPELNDGAQHHYVSVLTNNSISLYVDGELTATNPVGAANGGNAIDNAISKLIANATPTAGTPLGDYQATLGYLYGQDPLYIGSVNEYRIYNDAASANYVTRSFAAGPDAFAGWDDEFVLTMYVNPSTGVARIENTSDSTTTPGPVSFDYYVVESEAGSLNAGTWNSLSNQGIDDTLNSDFDESGSVDGSDVATFEMSYGADNGGDTNFDGVTNGADFLNLSRQMGQDPGPQDAWQEAGGSDSNRLAELHLNGATTLEIGESVSLGNIFSGTQDLTFSYALPGGLGVVPGLVVYSTAVSATSVPEPTTAVGLLAGAMLLLSSRRRS